jgi:hypothetical protein
MRRTAFILLLCVITLFSACNSGKKSDEIKNYVYKEPSAVMNKKLTSKVGDWVQEGTVCYGLVVGVNSQGKVLKGLPVKAKVITMKTDSFKMKALENVSLSLVKGCTKKGISKGEFWWETEGDLFKTKEEAVAFLTGKGWLLKSAIKP